MEISNEVKKNFDEKGYAVVKNFLEKDLCRKFVEHLFDIYKNKQSYKDWQCPLSESIRDDDLLDNFLKNQCNTISRLVGIGLLPTYSFARIYRNGEELKAHKDKPSCEVSVTITLGFDSEKPWEIFFDNDSGSCDSFEIEIGDAIIYKGAEVTHWRNKFKGDWQAQLFLHYVDSRKRESDSSFSSGHSISENSKINIPFLFHPNYNKDDSMEFAWQDNVFSKEEIERIVRSENKINFSDAMVGGKLVANYNERKAKISWLENCIDNYFIYSKISKASIILNSVYFQFDLYGFVELIQYSLYKEGDHHSWHYDMPTNLTAPPRKLSTVVMLSGPDEYEGGDLEIFNPVEPVKLEKVLGRVYVFPSYIYHRVTPVTKGTRRTLVGWVCGNRFK